jgi:hypothetical protein
MAANAVLNDPAWKVELICPGFQTGMGHAGPWYLMTKFRGQSLLPEGFVLDPFTGDADRNFDKTDADFAQVVRPRITLLKSFYKKPEDMISRETDLEMQADILRTAYELGLWSDPTDTLARAKAASSVEESELILREYEKNHKYGFAFSDYHFEKARNVAEALHAKKETYHKDLLSLLCYSDTYVPKE